MDNDYIDMFNDLFAYRIDYQEYINEEYIIINKLKNKLIDFGVEENEINNVLFNFYNYFDIPITMNQIETVPLHSPYSLYYDNHNNYNNLESNFLDESDNSDETDIFNGIDQEPHYYSTIIYSTQDFNTSGPINNLINLLFNLNNQQDINDDVLVTTNTESLNRLPICKITKDMQLICSICQEEMNENDEYIDIECKHIFHRNCLTTYLQNYNHICPTCRKEIGTAHVHL